MPRIAFTRHLEAVGPCEPCSYAGATVAELIEATARDYPRLKGYVLDDQGRFAQAHRRFCRRRHDPAREGAWPGGG